MTVLGSRGIEDPAIEKSFVASLLHNPERINRIAGQIPDDALIEPDCQAMYLAMLSLSGRTSDPFTATSLSHELLSLNLYNEVGKREGVVSFFEYGQVGNPIYYGNIVLDLHSRRLEMDYADEMHARAQDRSAGPKGDNDLAGRLSAMQINLSSLQKLTYDDERALPSSEFASFYDRLMNKREGELGKSKMHFAWPELNKYSPSFVDGDMIIMVAESGAGKTTLMEQQAEFMWMSGFHGIYYHLELNLDKMADRRMARATGVPYRVLQDGRQDGSSYTYLEDEERTLIRSAIANQARWPGSLTLKHCPGWTMQQICGDMKVRASEGRLDYVVIDYFNKVRAVTTRGSYITYDLGDAVELFKVTLEELYLVGVMAAQIDKEAKKSTGMLSVASARDTAVLDDKSNVGMWLKRPIDPITGERAFKADVYITKCNAGYEGKASLMFEGPRFRLVSIDDHSR